MGLYRYNLAILIAVSSLTQIVFLKSMEKLVYQSHNGCISPLYTSYDYYETLCALDSSIHSVVFSPDGSTILTGSGDGIARLWDSKTGKKLKEFRGHTGGIFSV